MRGTKVLSFLFKRVLPKKIQLKLVGKALQKAPTADCGVFAKARETNRAMRNSIIQDREMGKPMDFEDFEETLNSNEEAMDVMKGIFAEAKPVKIKGLYDVPTAESVASKSKDKNIFNEFFDSTGRAVDDEEMIIPSSLA